MNILSKNFMFSVEVDIDGALWLMSGDFETNLDLQLVSTIYSNLIERFLDASSKESFTPHLDILILFTGLVKTKYDLWLEFEVLLNDVKINGPNGFRDEIQLKDRFHFLVQKFFQHVSRDLLISTILKAQNGLLPYPIQPVSDCDTFCKQLKSLIKYTGSDHGSEINCLEGPVNEENEESSVAFRTESNSIVERMLFEEIDIPEIVSEMIAEERMIISEDRAAEDRFKSDDDSMYWTDHFVVKSNSGDVLASSIESDNVSENASETACSLTTTVFSPLQNTSFANGVPVQSCMTPPEPFQSPRKLKRKFGNNDHINNNSLHTVSAQPSNQTQSTATLFDMDLNDEEPESTAVELASSVKKRRKNSHFRMKKVSFLSPVKSKSAILVVKHKRKACKVAKKLFVASKDVSGTNGGTKRGAASGAASGVVPSWEKWSAMWSTTAGVDGDIGDTAADTVPSATLAVESVESVESIESVEAVEALAAGEPASEYSSGEDLISTGMDSDVSLAEVAGCELVGSEVSLGADVKTLISTEGPQTGIQETVAEADAAQELCALPEDTRDADETDSAVSGTTDNNTALELHVVADISSVEVVAESSIDEIVVSTTSESEPDCSLSPSLSHIAAGTSAGNTSNRSTNQISGSVYMRRDSGWSDQLVTAALTPVSFLVTPPPMPTMLVSPTPVVLSVTNALTGAVYSTPKPADRHSIEENAINDECRAYEDILIERGTSNNRSNSSNSSSVVADSTTTFSLPNRVSHNVGTIPVNFVCSMVSSASIASILKPRDKIFFSLELLFTLTELNSKRESNQRFVRSTCMEAIVVQRNTNFWVVSMTSVKHIVFLTDPELEKYCSTTCFQDKLRVSADLIRQNGLYKALDRLFSESNRTVSHSEYNQYRKNDQFAQFTASGDISGVYSFVRKCRLASKGEKQLSGGLLIDSTQRNTEQVSGVKRPHSADSTCSDVVPIGMICTASHSTASTIILRAPVPTKITAVTVATEASLLEGEIEALTVAEYIRLRTNGTLSPAGSNNRDVLDSQCDVLPAGKRPRHIENDGLSSNMKSIDNTENCNGNGNSNSSSNSNSNSSSSTAVRISQKAQSKAQNKVKLNKSAVGKKGLTKKLKLLVVGQTFHLKLRALYDTAQTSVLCPAEYNKLAVLSVEAVIVHKTADFIVLRLLVLSVFVQLSVAQCNECVGVAEWHRLLSEPVLQDMSESSVSSEVAVFKTLLSFVQQSSYVVQWNVGTNSVKPLEPNSGTTVPTTAVRFHLMR